MTVRELLQTISEHAEDGRLMDDPVVVRVGSQLREIESTYVDGTLILIAGDPH